jgi:glucose/arabinose dehydrogenase
MHKRNVIIGLALVGLASAASGASALTTTRIVTGLNRPLLVVAPPNDDRLFVLEQPGQIELLNLDGSSIGTFLDIEDLVVFGSGNDERGLLGMAFSPTFETDRLFYLNYSNNSGATTIARYQVMSGNPNLADESTAEIILTISQPFTNHNGGRIAFGPDGYLYIAMGDGGSQGDPSNRAQNLNDLLGKVLRIDVSGGLGSGYTNPPTNPFFGGVAGLDQIWAYGLRNPWGLTFDSVTGDLYVADVGQGSWEEVNVQAAASTGGENYGWRLMEGNHCFNPPSGCDDGSLVHPVHEYSHAGGRCSVTGGVLYRGSIAEIQGHYFFAEWCTSQIWSFRWNGAGGISDFVERTAEFAPDGSTISNISGFGTDGHGEMYLCDRGTGANGEIFKVMEESVAVPPVDARHDVILAAPNPFRTETRLALDLPHGEAVRVTIVDLQGRTVRRLVDNQPVSGDVVWDGRDDGAREASAGVYIVEIQSGERVSRSRVTLVR